MRAPETYMALHCNYAVVICEIHAKGVLFFSFLTERLQVSLA